MKHVICISILCLLSACTSLNKETNSEDRPYTYEDYQLQTVNMIAQPKFSGDSMLQQLTGADAKLERFYVKNKEVYFSCPKDKLTDAISKLAIHKDSVTVAKQEGPEQVLGDVVYRNKTRSLFMLHTNNFKIDTTKVLQTRYGNATYKITIPQMLDFITMKSNLRGGAFAVIGKDKYMISHGVAVSKKGEPSLTDLTNQLINKTLSKEANAQLLLNFVSNQIEYNDREAMSGRETIKRPDEILFTRNSDCSGKTILYASLLQQINIPWCLLYYKKHICVGVAGNFKPVQSSKITIRGTTYYIAETTTPGAVIGENVWGDRLKVEDLEYYHIPERGDTIYSYMTDKPLEFLKKPATEVEQ